MKKKTPSQAVEDFRGLIIHVRGTPAILDYDLARVYGVTSAQGTDTTAVSQPYFIEDVLEGEHIVEITRSGHATQRREVTVRRDMTLTLQIQLPRQFIPNYEVTTTRARHRGVLEFLNDEGIRLETAPGVSQTIPMRDVKKHGPLREGE